MYISQTGFRLRSLLEEWLEQLQRIRGFIGAVTDEQGHPLKWWATMGVIIWANERVLPTTSTPMDELSVAVEKWRSALSHAVTNRHTKIASMVGHMTQMVVM